MPRWGQGGLSLLLPAMAQLALQSRWQAWIAPPWRPYAPGLIQAGLPPQQLLIIEPPRQQPILWAMEACLQSGACATVLCWQSRVPQPQIRRLQRAAGQGNCWGILLRLDDQLSQPSPAPLRVQTWIDQQGLWAQVRKCRGSWGSSPVLCRAHTGQVRSQRLDF
jgi:cell division inhibitor SulA